MLSAYYCLPRERIGLKPPICSTAPRQDMVYIRLPEVRFQVQAEALFGAGKNDFAVFRSSGRKNARRRRRLFTISRPSVRAADRQSETNRENCRGIHGGCTDTGVRIDKMPGHPSRARSWRHAAHRTTQRRFLFQWVITRRCCRISETRCGRTAQRPGALYIPRRRANMRWLYASHKRRANLVPGFPNNRKRCAI